MYIIPELYFLGSFVDRSIHRGELLPAPPQLVRLSRADTHEYPSLAHGYYNVAFRKVGECRCAFVPRIGLYSSTASECLRTNMR